MTFGTTLVTTLLIVYRINSATKEGISGRSGSRTTFMHIVDIIVQSAAAYSLVALLYAISGVIPIASTNLVAIFNFQNWIGVLYLTVSVRTLQFQIYELH